MAIAMKGGSVDAPEKGSHMGRLLAILDLSLQPEFIWEGKTTPPRYMVSFIYELTGSENKENKPYILSEDFKVSDHDASKMYDRVTTLDPTMTLTKGGEDLSGLLTVPCMIEVDHNAKGYAKIKKVSGVPSNFQVDPLLNTPYTFEFDNPDMNIFNALPEFVQNKIKSALTYEGSELHKQVTMSAGGTISEDSKC